MKKFDYTLLVVEDSHMINNGLCSYLQKSYNPSFDVHSTFTLSEAKNILKDENVDFVILDLELPDGSGEDLINYIDTLGDNTKTKIVVLTGSVDNKRREKLFQMGVIDYLSKDNPLNFLNNEILKLINHYNSHKNLRVLVVDDSEVYLQHLKAILENHNYNVEISDKSNEVYKILKSGNFDLLVTDVEMPQMSGLELLHQIRKDDELLDLPIIAISGTTNQELITQMLKSGADNFLSKPFTTENFLLTVDVVIALYKKQRKLNELNHFLQEEIQRNVEELRKKEKLVELNNRHAQMGKMVSVLTHQWKQPLQGINLASDYIKQMGEGDEETLETVDMIQEQVRFLTETMDHFRTFFKPAKEQMSFSAVGAFEIVLKMLGDTYENIDITLEGDKELYIKGYPNEFYQIVVNLLNNAQDAFEEHQCKEREIKINVRQNNDKVIIKCCDNAGGIPEEIIDSLFKQYISTKGEQGTGIGLDISDTIIKKMNGTITVENINNGACFTIILPISTIQEGVQ